MELIKVSDYWVHIKTEKSSAVWFSKERKRQKQRRASTDFGSPTHQILYFRHARSGLWFIIFLVLCSVTSAMEEWRGSFWKVVLWFLG
ncbi:hypothetical protein MANES_01G220900v8 [Manihot esculenta]|uniref:Uncharacterized protein n=1 Tax=Manihot esculenta TaxID=3983 RepID=A0A2C9WNI4_MANES|nr:hypothetical protein MANES_01G220900v8 [Manihot esculenta]